jgi:hypothetical protein
MRKHGQNTKTNGPTPEYRCWQHIKTRCLNPKVREFKNYGGRGITVCDRWRESFEAFYADTGPRPSDKHSIDRFPNKDGNYEPGNCRWATQKEQQRNRTNNRIFVVAGFEACLQEHCDRAGVSHAVVLKRLAKGAPIEMALSPKRLRRGLFFNPELLAKLRAEIGATA